MVLSREDGTMNVKKQYSPTLSLSLKGCALIAAVETGLLPETEQDGKPCYNTKKFDEFWAMYTELAKKRQENISKERHRRA